VPEKTIKSGRLAKTSGKTRLSDLRYKVEKLVLSATLDSMELAGVMILLV